MKRIVFATNNQHKLQEIRDILGSGYEVVSLKEIGCDVDIPETGNTLEENALQKAHKNLQGAADDSGHRQKDYGHPHNGSPSIQKRPVCSWLCLIPGPDYPKQVQKHQHRG